MHMNLRCLLLLLVQSALLVLATDDKHRHCDKGALLAQSTWEAAIKACQYADATALATARFSFSLLATGCPSDGQVCCVDSGPLDVFLQRYTCDDKILYYEPPYNGPSVQTLANGTVLIGRYETIIQADGNLVIHNYRFHWNPVGRGKYLLDYIDGNDFNCPTYLFELLSCSECQ
jgi:hypothetical protein